MRRQTMYHVHVCGGSEIIQEKNGRGSGSDLPRMLRVKTASRGLQTDLLVVFYKDVYFIAFELEV